MLEITDEVYACLPCGDTELYERKEMSGSPYLSGFIATQNGYVSVYSRGDKVQGWTQFNYLWQGKQYRRKATRGYTKRGLVTLASRFAAEVVAGEVGNG